MSFNLFYNLFWNIIYLAHNFHIQWTIFDLIILFFFTPFLTSLPSFSRLSLFPGGWVLSFSLLREYSELVCYLLPSFESWWSIAEMIIFFFAFLAATVQSADPFRWEFDLTRCDNILAEYVRLQISRKQYFLLISGLLFTSKWTND